MGGSGRVFRLPEVTRRSLYEEATVALAAGAAGGPDSPPAGRFAGDFRGSRPWAYDLRSGALEATFPITFTNPFLPIRALSRIAFGPDGKLYAIEPFVGVIRMHLDPNNTQELYSPASPLP
jgi:hypothetical protein